MFSKTKEPDSTVPALLTAQNSPAAQKGPPSIINGELIVRGALISQGDVQVDGRVEGDIRAASLVIGDKATVVGDVYADEATVHGCVQGSVTARHVKLSATCHVEGNLLHDILSVEAGAYFEGNCCHADNPLADAPDADVRSSKSMHVEVQPSAPEHHPTQPRAVYGPI